jgi:soluble lytic murein transglycosylase-like protein
MERRLIKHTITLLSLIFILSLIGMFLLDKKQHKPINLDIKSKKGEVNTPNSIIMYEMINKYSDIYEIPKYIAFNIAYRETRYRGPFHYDYDHKQGSSAGALGPMQIMPSTARHISKIIGDLDKFTDDELKSNIELNVMLSMIILRRSYNRHKDWSIVCGEYNTGKYLINEYAIYCSSNKNYKKKWVYFE